MVVMRETKGREVSAPAQLDGVWEDTRGHSWEDGALAMLKHWLPCLGAGCPGGVGTHKG